MMRVLLCMVINLKPTGHGIDPTPGPCAEILHRKVQEMDDPLSSSTDLRSVACRQCSGHHQSVVRDTKQKSVFISI